MSSTPYSQHVEEAVEKLHATKELPSDNLLVYLVKVQRLLESVELGLGLKDPTDGENESASTVLLFVSAFTSDLRRLKSQMSQDVAENSESQKPVSSSKCRAADQSLSRHPNRLLRG